MTVQERQKDLLQHLLREPALVMLLGAMDTGKSTLARLVVTGGVESGTPVTLIDADVGQSALCLPGTVSMKTFRKPDDLLDYRCTRFTFLGSASPAKIIPQLLSAVAYFRDRAAEQGGLTVVDTSGLVEGEFGKGVKLAKIRLLQPGHVVAIQRKGECEPILEHLDEIAVYRLAPHPEARARNREFRASTRNARLAAYFAGKLIELIVKGERTGIYRFGRRVSLHQELVEPGTVIGLGSRRETVSLGIVTESDPHGITCTAPILPRGRIGTVTYGDIALELQAEPARPGQQHPA